MRSGRRIGCLILISCLPHLLSCTIRITEPDRLPEAVRMHDVTPYLQDPDQCGPYALAALLRYMGIEADGARMARRLHSPGAGGTLTMDLFLEAGRRGLEAEQLSGSTDLLVKELEHHFPVIVLLKYPGLLARSGHFILVTGYSGGPGGFFLLWGDGEVSWMSENRFSQFWSGSGFWMLKVRREGGE